MAWQTRTRILPPSDSEAWKLHDPHRVKAEVELATDDRAMTRIAYVEAEVPLWGGDARPVLQVSVHLTGTGDDSVEGAAAKVSAYKLASELGIIAEAYAREYPTSPDLWELARLLETTVNTWKLEGLTN